MNLTYDCVIPSPIENTRVEKIFSDGIHTGFRLTPDTGYVLHNALNDHTDEFGIKTTYFCSGDTTVKYDYDFDDIIEDTYTYIDENNNQITIPVLTIGEYKFYTITKSIVSPKQIY